MPRPTYENIDDYIATCQPEVQPLLHEVRNFIKKHAPEASEKISWSMPTFYLNGNLVHFAAQKKHLGLYPGAKGIEVFIPEFEKLGYKYSKGAVQFPFSKPIPWNLIQQIVEFRVKEVTSSQKE